MTTPTLPQSLGIPARTLTAWRKLPHAPAGDDELAWRLWHACHLEGGPKAKTLSAPSPEHAAILDLVRARIATAASDDPGRQVKERQVTKLDQQIARGEQVMIAEAEAHFRKLVGSITKSWNQGLPGLLDRCYQAATTANGSIAGQRALRKLLDAALNKHLDQALARLAK